MNEPYFTNHCSHDGYIGSMETRSADGCSEVCKRYDIYVWTKYNEDRLCIRYGSEGHEYISPGTLKRNDIESFLFWTLGYYKEEFAR